MEPLTSIQNTAMGAELNKLQKTANTKKNKTKPKPLFAARIERLLHQIVHAGRSHNLEPKTLSQTKES
jgi:hypothetical protein